MLKGFYFQTPSKGYFFIGKKRTKKLCKDVEEYLEQEGCRLVYDGMYHGEYCTFTIKEKLLEATCEVKDIESLGAYYDIKVKNFGSAGGFINEGKIMLVLL